MRFSTCSMLFVTCSLYAFSYDLGTFDPGNFLAPAPPALPIQSSNCFVELKSHYSASCIIVWRFFSVFLNGRQALHNSMCLFMFGWFFSFVVAPVHRLGWPCPMLIGISLCLPPLTFGSAHGLRRHNEICQTYGGRRCQERQACRPMVWYVHCFQCLLISVWPHVFFVVVLAGAGVCQPTGSKSIRIWMSFQDSIHWFSCMMIPPHVFLLEFGSSTNCASIIGSYYNMYYVYSSMSMGQFWFATKYVPRFYVCLFICCSLVPAFVSLICLRAILGSNLHAVNSSVRAGNRTKRWRLLCVTCCIHHCWQTRISGIQFYHLGDILDVTWVNVINDNVFLFCCFQIIRLLDVWAIGSSSGPAPRYVVYIKHVFSFCIFFQLRVSIEATIAPVHEQFEFCFTMMAWPTFYVLFRSPRNSGDNVRATWASHLWSCTMRRSIIRIDFRFHFPSHRPEFQHTLAGWT